MIPRPLRFCMITTFYPPYHFGGDAVFVHRLSNELARRGHRVDVIHSIDSYHLLGGGKPDATYDNHPNVEIHGLESRWGALSPLSTLLTGVPLCEQSRIRGILAAGFDVIHYHNVSLVGGPKVLEYGRAIKLYTPHEYWLVCPTHMLFRFRREPCVRRDCLACTLFHKRPPQLWRHTGMLRRGLRHIDAFLGFTSFMPAIHRQNGCELPFVPLRSFLPLEDGHLRDREPAGAAYFLYVGRLEKLKGLETLIPLFRRYSRAQLWIAGTGNYEGRLRRLAEGCGNIRFLGHLPYDRLHSLYSDAVAVIVPSLFYEISPLVVVEAASHKTPVIARNLGGMREIVSEMGGGIVYDTEQELVSAMDRLSCDSALRDELGRRGYAAARETWSAEAHVDRYLSLIAAIAARRGIDF